MNRVSSNLSARPKAACDTERTARSARTVVFTRAAIRPLAATACALLLLAGGAARAGGQAGGTVRQSAEPRGDVRQVHDPALIRAGATYYLFSTRAGLSVRCSNDLLNWRLCGDVFAHLPQWAVEDVPGVRGLWAPDVAFFNGKYHLYYSVSTFGSNRSSIGLATNRTLDPDSPQYRWEDHGKVVGSQRADDWNAIDPNVVLDEAGVPWLSFGSFWGGIKMRRLDPATGKLDARDETLYPLAARPRGPGEPGAVEAPFVVRKSGYYYLFVSFDFCCRGANSTYNVRVGRSRRVTGPYADRDVRDMREGGGTPVVSGDARWRGTGHCAVLLEAGGDKLVYHAYDAEWRGVPTLRVSPLVWDAQGWPSVVAAGKR